MQDATHPHVPAARNVVIPEAAHLALVEMSEHLHLMARLTKIGASAGGDPAQVTQDAMAWCFSRLARDLDEVIGVTCWAEAEEDPA